ncbi:hypothetical protein NMB0762 [Neisseria meningitidis MC58]|uniref:Uncharacterized protein n=1 Tax=Neisseria meningitidis serogroup B (strain ATCC BAA-335 / MC58) TaxID=122586 RepID=Q9K058_NEIMB|nr:hypothetical protein NMB0762 [Neisseria meningitidis MC58]
MCVGALLLFGNGSSVCVCGTAQTLCAEAGLLVRVAVCADGGCLCPPLRYRPAAAVNVRRLAAATRRVDGSVDAGLGTGAAAFRNWKIIRCGRIGTKSYKERNFGYWFFRRHRFRIKPYPKFVYVSAQIPCNRTGCLWGLRLTVETLLFRSRR